MRRHFAPPSLNISFEHNLHYCAERQEFSFAQECFALSSLNSSFPIVQKTSGMPPVLLHVGSNKPQSTAGKAIGATLSDGKTRITLINVYFYGDSIGTQEWSCAAARTNTNWTAAADSNADVRGTLCVNLTLPSLRLYSFGNGEKFVTFIANGCSDGDSVSK